MYIDDEGMLVLGRERLQLSGPDKIGLLSAEAASKKSKNSYQSVVDVLALEGVTGKDVPRNLSLRIDGPTGISQGLDGYTLVNMDDGPRFLLSFYFSFDRWNKTINLVHFIERLREQIEINVPGGISTYTGENPEGIDLFCEFRIGADADCYGAFRTTDEKINELARRALATGSPANASIVNVSERGLHWWLRYVVVPLVSSAAFAAAITWWLRSW